MKITIDWMRTLPANHRKLVCVRIVRGWFGRLIGLKDKEIYFVGYGTKKIYK